MRDATPTDSQEPRKRIKTSPYNTPEQGELFEKPLLNPAYPNPSTLPGIALARLLTGERLTQPSFGLHCWRLAAYIKELDYLGWPIERVDVPCPEGYGTGRPIREYWLSQQTLLALSAARVQS